MKKIVEFLSANEVFYLEEPHGIIADFSDFREKYGIPDMYSGGFYPFPSPEEYWAW